MINIEFQEFLKRFPAETPIKLMFDSKPTTEPVKFTSENIMLTSETASVDDSYPEEQWDCEDGKIVLGDGERYLLINPIII